MNHTKISRRNFIKTTGAGIAALPLSKLVLSCGGDASRPNIVVIQMDDLGWADIGIHGNTFVETPNIDRLARESVRCNQFYVNPVCAPSRAAFLTGRDFLRTGVSHVHGGKDFVHLDEVTIADFFKAAGYVTGMWGKWHSGHTDGYFPWERGFDEAYMADLYKHRNNGGKLNGDRIEHSEWADEVITNRAIKFIKNAGERPFFCYLSSLTCHEPLDAPEELRVKYEQKGLSSNLATLYAMIDLFDTQLGRLLDFLQERALDSETIILFMSDNGPAINNRWFTDEDREIRNVNTLKGHKGNIWENGVKSPLFIRWPQHFPSTDVDDVCDITDILPTLLDLCGIEDKISHLPFDGFSFKSVLKGNPRDWAERKMSFNYAHPAWQPTDKPWTPKGVLDEYRPLTRSEVLALSAKHQTISLRQGPYKLLLNPDTLKNQAHLIQGYALYNILKDPHEEQNLLNEEPALADSFKQDLHQWFESIKKEKHAFSMPVFLIGQNGKKQSTVWAKGPHKISAGLHNAFNYLSGWDRPGDRAEYKIRVMTKGIYTVMLHHDSSQASQALISLSIDGQKHPVTINHNQTVDCGEFELNERDYTLTVKVIDASPHRGMPVMGKMVSLVFNKKSRK